METQLNPQINHLDEYVPAGTSLANLLEHVQETGKAMVVQLYGQAHHVRAVKYDEDFRALKVTLDSGLYALYQRSTFGWTSV